MDQRKETPATTVYLIVQINRQNSWTNMVKNRQDSTLNAKNWQAFFFERLLQNAYTECPIGFLL